MKKTCSKCIATKSIDDFALNIRRSDGRQSWCRTCSSIRYKNMYSDADFRIRLRKRASLRIKAAHEFVLSYLLEHPCVSCDERDPVVLQFDHVRGKKVADIANAIHNGWSIERIKTEISKCEVRCSNCHIRRTSKVGLWFKSQHSLVV